MRVHHLAVRVADLERSRRFYCELLGLPEVRRFAHPDGSLRSIWLQAGEALLMLETQLAGEGGASGTGHLLAFAVSDLPAWRTRMARGGVALDGGSEHTLYVRDPDGHRVGLSDY